MIKGQAFSFWLALQAEESAFLQARGAGRNWKRKTETWLCSSWDRWSPSTLQEGSSSWSSCRPWRRRGISSRWGREDRSGPKGGDQCACRSLSNGISSQRLGSAWICASSIFSSTSRDHLCCPQQPLRSNFDRGWSLLWFMSSKGTSLPLAIQRRGSAPWCLWPSCIGLYGLWAWRQWWSCGASSSHRTPSNIITRDWGHGCLRGKETAAINTSNRIRCAFTIAWAAQHRWKDYGLLLPHCAPAPSAPPKKPLACSRDHTSERYHWTCGAEEWRRAKFASFSSAKRTERWAYLLGFWWFSRYGIFVGRRHRWDRPARR